ncbi:hypothetical protein GLUCOINTEAF2_0204185 [Komagataeibacter intermedius AF2]|uniref:Uncharacterized protein n=1 Tax=Komagataeibacter intermedius AF2 TaxID=1458464 RepID=A0A0N0MFT2_9PROT|nr:hypothetical protein GLUCOINTEAF2_0204185 [Komagataeibacter intermedius AF2]
MGSSPVAMSQYTVGSMSFSMASPNCNVVFPEPVAPPNSTMPLLSLFVSRISCSTICWSRLAGRAGIGRMTMWTPLPRLTEMGERLIRKRRLTLRSSATL